MTEQNATMEERAAPSVRWALAGLAMTMLLASLGISIANVALPTLVQAFGASFQAVQWVVLAYLLAVTTLIVSAGRLGDQLGHRRVLLAGIAIFTSASALCGAAATLPMLIAARALQGLGAAILMALTLALVRETIAKDKTGSAMGLLGTMSAVGTALGPSLGGLLLAGPGWRAIFYVMVPLGLVGFLLIWRSLPAGRRVPPGDSAGFDAWGTLLLGLTLAGYALSMTVGRGDFGGLNAALLAAAAAAAVVLVLVETRVASPLLRPAMFRDAALSASLVMNALVATVMAVTLVVGPFYLSRALGLDAVHVGAVLSVGPVVSALSGVPAGRIVDHLGARAMVVAGLALMLAGTVALAALPGLFGLAGYITALAVLAPGYQLFLAANNTAVMADVAQDRRGVLSGLLNLARNLGFVTGASVMGAVFAAAVGESDITAASPDAVAFGLRIAFAVAAGLIAAALATALAAPLRRAVRRPAAVAD
ncbi:MFS transporter [Pelagibius sp. 7325]|uniref:MFS transporter n=1 Tax=Pelagibius sp. 7325 TaxID=3131994 RepID=UPI0030EE6C6C